MKILTTMILTLATVSALADVPRPRVEPGPVQNIEDSGVEAMDAMLMAKSADLTKFIKAGNTINGATFQAVKPEMTVYTFTRQNCMLGGITGGQCLGGAQLRVTVTYKRAGSSLTKTAVSTVSLLR